MIEISGFLGLVTVLMVLAYYINYRKFGEELYLDPKDFLIFQIYDHQSKVKQIKFFIFLTMINKGLKKIEITDISLNLRTDKIQVPITLATKSQFLISEEISPNFPFQINKNERYDKILSFTMDEILREELTLRLIAKSGRETVISGKCEIKLTVKYSTIKERNFCLKLNLDERAIVNLPEIVNDHVILPIVMFKMLWEINNRQLASPRKFYLG